MHQIRASASVERGWPSLSNAYWMQWVIRSFGFVSVPSRSKRMMRIRTDQLAVD